MYNTSTTRISYVVYENGSPVLSGVIPYALLWTLENAVLNGTSRTVELTVLTDVYTRAKKDSTQLSVVSTDPAQPEMAFYATLQDARQRDAIAKEDAAAARLVQATTNQQLADMARADLEAQAQAAFIQQQFVQASEQAQAEFNAQQQQFDVEYFAKLEAEQQRLDLLRVHTVTQIAVDPTRAVEALMSEVGSNGDVCRQIALEVSKNVDIAKLILASTATLYNANFDIMEALTTSASVNTDVAVLLEQSLPEDSALKSMLEKFTN
jgi:hypothetical protein